MPSHVHPLRLLVGVLLLAFAGCGGPGDAGPSEPDARADLLSQACWDRWQRSESQYVEFHVPRGRHARFVLKGPDEFVVVIYPGEFPGEWVQMRGVFRWMPSGDAEDREAFLRVLRRELNSASVPGESGTSRLTLVLNAARGARWGEVGEVLGCAFDVPGRRGHLRWAIRRAGTFLAVDPEADVRRRAEPGLAPGVSPLAIDLVALRGEDDVEEVVLAMGEKTWAFDPERARSEDSDDALFPHAAFEEAVAHIHVLAATHDLAVIRTSDPEEVLAWEHVVTVLDVLLGAGLWEVDLPEAGIRLSLLEPHDVDGASHAAGGEPVVTPLALVLVAVGVLLAFVVTLWPLRRGRELRWWGRRA